MVVLQFHWERTQGFSVKLDKKVVRIGRSPDCDVCLDDPGISREHVILRQTEAGWILEDASLNGISRSGAPLSSARQKLEFGQPYELSRACSLIVSSVPSLDAITPTVKRSEQCTRFVQKKGLSDLQVIQARLFGKSLPSTLLKTRRLGIGRHPSNDIVLANPSVSDFHARLEHTDQGFRLQDLNSTNGTWVDGAQIESVLLNKSSQIRFGGEEISLEIAAIDAPTTASKGKSSFFGMHSRNKQMKQLFVMAEIVGLSPAPVFIHGETGTGKELLARAIHGISSRSDGPLISINCAALPPDLLESELFGHEKGAFTGAMSARLGAFEAAHGGTLFLDEIGELDIRLQAKLLRALESGEIQKVGSTSTTKVDVRIVSATHQDLSELVALGKFREDLFYRLYVVPLEIPALRDRIEDLDLLIPELLHDLRIPQFVGAETLEALKLYDFPGNVRELRNILQRAAIEATVDSGTSTKELLIKHFRFLRVLEKFKPVRTQEEAAEKSRILESLRNNSFKQLHAAKELGIAISTLNDKIRRYGIALPAPANPLTKQKSESPARRSAAI